MGTSPISGHQLTVRASKGNTPKKTGSWLSTRCVLRGDFSVVVFMINIISVMITAVVGVVIINSSSRRSSRPTNVSCYDGYYCYHYCC